MANQKTSVVRIEGFDIVAQCVTDNGRVVILNNNADTYLVGTNYSLGTEGFAPTARIYNTYAYGIGYNTFRAFAQALASMSALALAESDSLDADTVETQHETVKGNRTEPSKVFHASSRNRRKLFSNL